jgi:Rod binding domain-containing protein
MTVAVRPFAAGVGAFSAPDPSRIAALREPIPEIPAAGEDDRLREKFREFVAGTFLRMMLTAMRKALPETKLIHGGKAEEIFRSQLDQTLAERVANAAGDGLTDKLFEQFQRMIGSRAGERAENTTDEHHDRQSGPSPLGLPIRPR